jgi:hypothetical protein
MQYKEVASYLFENTISMKSRIVGGDITLLFVKSQCHVLMCHTSIPDLKTLILDICTHVTTHTVNNGVSMNFNQEYFRIILSVLSTLL